MDGVVGAEDFEDELDAMSTVGEDSESDSEGEMVDEIPSPARLRYVHAGWIHVACCVCCAQRDMIGDATSLVVRAGREAVVL